MKLVSVSCIKNEADIIETFVRVNAVFIDTFVFVDDSEDGTAEILGRLASEGIRIVRLLRPNKEEPYLQDQMVLSAVRYVVDQKIECDFILPLDSDEFPKFSNRAHAEQVLQSIPAGHIGAYYWETYVPDNSDFEQIVENGLSTCFRRRIPEGSQYEKIVIPISLASEIYVAVGSHMAVRMDSQPLDKYMLSENLGHFPVRSATQIIKKNVSAAYWLMRKETRFFGEGLHVFEILRHLVDSHFDLSLDQLKMIGASYANEEANYPTLGAAPDWIQPYRLKYTQSANTSLLKIMSTMLVESWLKPFSEMQTPELRKVLKQDLNQESHGSNTPA
jgi:hypothetical protein